jgi:5-methylcytosine-specific restriction endonuclease McrA
MAQDFARDFYRGKTWQRCREGYIKYRHGLCERCLSKGLYRPGIIVHHKIHLTPDNITDPSVSLSFDNLQLLCRDCHAVMHKPEKRFKVDELGRVITI